MSDRLGASTATVLNVLRTAQDELERKVAAELNRTNTAHQATRRELEEARAYANGLQRDLDKMTTQKNYVADAFENSRKEMTRLRTENQLQKEELARLRSAVEELAAEKVARGVARKVIDVELSGLEVERDVLSRALGAASKQLFGKQQHGQQHGESGASSKARPPTATPGAKKAPKRAGSPQASPGRASPGGGAAQQQPTGGARRASVGGGRGSR